MDILQAARQLFPGTAWNLSTDSSGNRTLTQVNDSAPRVSVPDLATLDGIVSQVAYVEKRQGAYPPIGDQLDALWSFVTVVPNALPADTVLMLSKIQAVKAQFPKGS